ncbi:MAG: hypothetical protein J0I32_20075 [Sphingobacteriales bacterium]|nr:hypothetical protein [Sphingobacteriales bacterium]OJV98806.1 MAG: hypothetical protein BGO52_08535 [Sphingobacteriales bacterium 44-61]
MKVRNLAVTVIILLFIALWVYAGFSKIGDYDNFKFQLGRSPYVQHLADFIAKALPTAEIITALLFIPKATRLLAMYLSFFGMLIFTGYIYAMLNYSYFVPCSCGGILNDLGWHEHLIFNIFFTLLALTGIILMVYNRNISRGTSPKDTTTLPPINRPQVAS